MPLGSHPNRLLVVALAWTLRRAVAVHHVISGQVRVFEQLAQQVEQLLPPHADRLAIPHERIREHRDPCPARDAVHLGDMCECMPPAVLARLVREDRQHVLVAMPLRQRLHRWNVHLGIGRPHQGEDVSLDDGPAVGERLKVVLERLVQACPRLGVIEDAAVNLVFPLGRGLLVHLKVEHGHDRDATHAHPRNDAHRITSIYYLG
jgi:hypothetical protein